MLSTGRCILRNNYYSRDTIPNLSWLPTVLSNPSVPSNPTVTQEILWHQVHPHATTCNGGCLHQPNPDWVDSSSIITNPPPLLYAMGGHPSLGSFSPLTMSFAVSVYGRSCNHLRYGGYRQICAHIPGRRAYSSGSLLVASSVANSMQPTLLDSSDTSPLAPVVASAGTPTVFLAISDVTPSPVVPSAPVDPALSTIKDKPLDLGIKPIKDKDSWINAKKVIVIDAHLHRAPYWSGPSKNLITTSENATASGWWEEVLAFFCEPPVSDLFAGETKFDGKGFERLECIDHHFHPSGAVDSLGYIFDLIDIKKKMTSQSSSSRCNF
jgi:hypothetical protein